MVSIVLVSLMGLSHQTVHDDPPSKVQIEPPTRIPPEVLAEWFKTKPDPEAGMRLQRVRRWKINLKYQDPEGFVKKLAELKITVGARMENGKFFIFSDLTKQPPVYE